jgi:hypothetical protein
MDDDGVRAAFELIQEEIGSLSNELKEQAKQLIDTGEFDQVQRLMEMGKNLDQFQLEVKALEQKWVTQFDPSTRSKTEYKPEPVSAPSDGTLALVMNYQSAKAHAEMKGKEVTILPGSTIRKESFGSMQDDVLKRKNKAIQKGELKDSLSPLLFELMTPIIFPSPSAAAVFVAGCSVNGRREWHVAQQGVSLKSWQMTH